MSKTVIVLMVILLAVSVGAGYLVWQAFNQPPAAYPTIPNTNSTATPGTPASNLPPLPPEPAPTPLVAPEPNTSSSPATSSAL